MADSDPLTGKQPDSTSDQVGDHLLALVGELAREIHQQHSFSRPLTMDTLLDRELGFDSLSRVELLLRIEKTFEVNLPEQLLASAETPGDLLRALQQLERQPRPRLPAATLAQAAATDSTPNRVETLNELLDWHCARHPERQQVLLSAGGGPLQEISYGDLRLGAQKIAAGLRDRGLSPGWSVAIMLPTSKEYLFSFFGILLAGAVPVPIYPPVRPSQLEDHLRRHALILTNAQVRLLITTGEARRIAQLLSAQVEGLEQVVTPEVLAESGQGYTALPVKAEDTAFMQYTSGSTGQPKGVVLTHGDLLANIRAMGEAIQASSKDIFVSWLPLYHDMGLIGAWLGSLYYAMPLVLMSPLAFLARPSRWLRAIHEHHATLSAAPNFAYELCLGKIDDQEMEGLDLSSWRLAFNGAEPVSPQTLTRFSERFAANGLRPDALAPVYGLAEAAVGLAFPPVGRPPLIDRIQRETLRTQGKAVAAGAGEQQPLEIAACGQPLPGYQIRIVDTSGRELPERREGSIQFQGPSATSGYFRNPEANRQLFAGAWLNTGDLGYLANGDLYLTSRSKDLIIRGGRNLYPYETEQAVGELEGIRKGCVALFGSNDPVSGTEQIVLVAESREQRPEKLALLREKIQAVTIDLLGLPPDRVIIAPPHRVLKTSSGKIRRSAMRDLYQQNRLENKPDSVWRQAARLVLHSILPAGRRLRRRLADLVYAAYAHLVFWLLAPPVWLLIALLPGRQLRWRVMRGGARLLFTLTGVPLYLEGKENLPSDQPCVLVANHASYLDGVVIAALLPREVSFVAKAELAQSPISRRFLQRIGALFVERFDRGRSLEDARAVTETLDLGESLFFFPEGTFARAPGLLAFHLGAFVAATDSNVPLIPITIRGTRSLLLDNNRMPHRGAVSVLIEEPLQAEGSGWRAAIQLRDAARARILRHLGEPDMASQKLSAENTPPADKAP